MPLSETYQVITPDFWPGTLKQIEDHLRRLRKGRVETFGLSAGNRPLWAAIYETDPSLETLYIIGGTHGHEPGTCVACLNAMHVLEHGLDMKGEPLPALTQAAEKLNFVFIPVLNADGRARLPAGFYGTTVDLIDFHEMGMTSEHKLNRAEDGSLIDCIDPEKMILLGGRYNDAGFLMNRPVSVEESRSVEVRQLLDWCAKRPPDCLVDLHGCAYNFFIMNRLLPDDYREKLRTIDRRVTQILQARGSQVSPLHGDREPPESGFVSNTRMFYHRYATLAFIFEGRQGFLGYPPLHGYDRILDDYLTAIAQTARLGAEEGFRP